MTVLKYTLKLLSTMNSIVYKYFIIDLRSMKKK